VTFVSTQVELGDDGRATVQGELTIRGVTRPVTATGEWIAPTETPGGVRAGLELETTFDRRDFGIDWQMEAPNGGIVLDWDVTLTANLELLAGEE
jgi:polyisoprenoid-binding protein YceI